MDTMIKELEKDGIESPKKYVADAIKLLERTRDEKDRAILLAKMCRAHPCLVELAETKL